MYAKFLTVFLLGTTAALSGCATSPKNPDPLEGMNRKIFQFNETVDKYALKPVAKGYQAVTPDFLEQGINNAINNLFYTTVIINQFLQGKFKEGVQDTTRLVFNTTLGVGGLFDVASAGGMPKHNEDFGQTLGAWGFDNGAYLVLPILGPSSVRDGVGRVGDLFTNPVFYIEEDSVRYGLAGMTIINTRANLLKTESLITGDKYLFLRDAYLERRKYLVNDEKIEESDPFLNEQE
ncbi:MAG: VacJ family lipoprotein [Proteobacteria bacterium]|nr:VacJ family lipoprotein [Pseudomonadota bacterium]